MSWIDRVRKKFADMFSYTDVVEASAGPNTPAKSQAARRRRHGLGPAASIKPRQGKPRRPRRPKAAHRHAYQFRDAVLCNDLRASRLRDARMLKARRKARASTFAAVAGETLEVA